MQPTITKTTPVAAQRYAGFFLFSCFPFFTAPAAKKEKTPLSAPAVPPETHTPPKKCVIGDFFGVYLIKKEFDQEGEGDGIALYNFEARMYDPKVGIFISTDPMEEFHNLYSYTGGNPVNLIDPTGLSTDVLPVVQKLSCR